MKKLTLALFAAGFLLYACNNEKGESKSENTGSDTTAKADPCAGYVPDTTQKMDTAMAAMMAAWEAYAKPGEMHAMLAKSDGEWDSEVTQWWDPNGPPTKSKGVAKNMMVMGGRYQHSEFGGCMMGAPFEGNSLVGYDNAKKTFFSLWIDNMGTGVMHMEGPYDPVTKTIKFAGTCVNPADGKQMNVREEFTLVDDNTQKMVMWMPGMDGKEMKSMEITFTRKK
jgi:hypothetical protein